VKAEEGKHGEHDDDQTDEINDTVHGTASSMTVQLRVGCYVPLREKLF
jgi:hypothetical protein